MISVSSPSARADGVGLSLLIFVGPVVVVIGSVGLWARAQAKDMFRTYDERADQNALKMAAGRRLEELAESYREAPIILSPERKIGALIRALQAGHVISIEVLNHSGEIRRLSFFARPSGLSITPEEKRKMRDRLRQTLAIAAEPDTGVNVRDLGVVARLADLNGDLNAYRGTPFVEAGPRGCEMALGGQIFYGGAGLKSPFD